MDYLDKFFDKQYLMHTPTSFLLQNKTLEDLCSLHDDNGWTIMHYAVGHAEIEKIKEFIYFNMNFNKNSHKNYIPRDIFILNEKKKNPDKFEIFDKIPFVKKGFTPIHLAIYLYNYYINLNKSIGGNDFFYHNIIDKYKKILDLLLTKERVSENPVDDNGKSYLDYAFLTENIKIIELIHNLDPEFNSFRKVNPKTAKRILEVMEIKYKEKLHDHLIKKLDIKILQSNLQDTLPQKNKDFKINYKI